jgi:hypothetical protein
MIDNRGEICWQDFLQSKWRSIFCAETGILRSFGNIHATGWETPTNCRSQAVPITARLHPSQPEAHNALNS